MLDGLLNFLDRHSIGLFHVPAVSPNLLEEFLGDAGGPVHHQVGVWNASVDLFDARDRQNVASWFAREFVGAMAGADGNR